MRAQVVVGLEVLGAELDQHLARAAVAAAQVVLAYLRAGDRVDEQEEVGPILRLEPFTGKTA